MSAALNRVRRPTPGEVARADIGEAMETLYHARGLAGALVILDRAKIDFVLLHREEAEAAGWIV